MKAGPDVARERLFELFEDVGTTLRWKVSSNNRTPVGHVVQTTTPAGYLVVRFDGRRHYVHRLLWIMRHGYIPAGKQIDHIDGQRDNNVQENLRLATCTENLCNMRRGKANKSGVKGVFWDAGKRRWKGKVVVHGRAYMTSSSACLATVEQRVQALRARIHGNFTNHGIEAAR